jgi:hypothetical protein
VSDDSITVCETLEWPDLPGHDAFALINEKYLRPMRKLWHEDGCTSKVRRYGNRCVVEVTGPAGRALDIRSMLGTCKDMLAKLVRQRAESRERNVDAFLEMMRGGQQRRERAAAEMLLDALAKRGEKQ